MSSVIKTIVVKTLQCTVKCVCVGVRQQYGLLRRHPKTIACALVGGIIAHDVLHLYAAVYRVENPWEFVPTEGPRGVIVLRVYNALRFTAAKWRWNCWTIFGKFPFNSEQFSRIMETSTERKPDLRPLLVPAHETIEVYPCNNIHSHPRSAEFRSSANEYLVRSVRRAGYPPYVVSSSKRDFCDGNRFFYCPKDFGMQFRNDPISNNHALVFTDVDYYANMNRWLQLFLPTCLYTLVPTRLNYSNDEFAYRFENNEIVYNVTGGGEYRHSLWDYKGDTVTVVDEYGNLLIFDIEQRRVQGDEQHRLIWLLPKAKITDPLWIVGPTEWYDKLLVRKTVQQGRLKILWEPIADDLSIGLHGSNYSVSLKGELFEAIRTRISCKDSTPYVSDVERMLREAKHKNFLTDAPILYHCFQDDVIIRPNVVKTGSFPVTYNAIPKKAPSVTEDPKMPGQVVTTPLVSQPALFAGKGFNADKACIEGRIEKVRNVTKFPIKYVRYAAEFVKLVIPETIAGTGVPNSIGMIREEQDKVAQRARFDRVAPIMSTQTENSIKAFIKTEMYAAAKAPRNISTMAPEITIQSSAYSLPMAKIFKKIPWYCPGKNPKEITLRLAEVCLQDPDHELEEGDYTCMDGTQSPDYSDLLLLPIYMRYFAKQYRGQFKNLYNQIYKQRATTSSGVPYNPEMTIRSGSSITTHAGTLNNAFNIYAALRDMGYDETTAWDKVGAVFGDDSLNANHQGEFHSYIEHVTKVLGMRYKSNLRERGQPVLFLGRYFVDPITSYDSFADPMRTIGKLHATANKNVSVEQGAANKAHGYITTDSKTPIIGAWARRVLEITKKKFKNGTGEEQYRCSNAWPQKDEAAIRAAMAAVLEVDEAQLIAQNEAVLKVNSLDQFPVVFDTYYDHKQLAEVDGQLVGTDLHIKEEDERQPETSIDSVPSTGPPPSNGDPNAGGKPTDGPSKGKRKVKGRRPRTAGDPATLRLTDAGSSRRVKPPRKLRPEAKRGGRPIETLVFKNSSLS
uniref:RNA-directed RNA polymerase n=1 Tax=Pieris rapae virus TaxID=327392 RepID=RDRP_PRV|nr:RecName: Full=RNA-directed RNA polymerase; Short=RdRp; AltName: Full=RNA replicase [Pieris rapae virus]AAY27743.1 RNA-dependent RNA polymerase [Pieris rapae virus]